MKPTWFVTGTDTGVGKTWCTLGLIQHFRLKGFSVAGMKPIASGSQMTPLGLRNSDAERLLSTSGLEVPYAWVNPYAWVPPIAPHLAAEQAGQKMSIEPIVNAYQQLATHADVVLIEGVGGWRVPLNEKQSLKDLVLAIQAPVVLVVGLRLGCINHALLTAETIERDGCTLVGWIANEINADAKSLAVIETLANWIPAPLLAHIPFLATSNLQLITQTMHAIRI